MIKNAKLALDPASSFLGLSAATVAGRFWPSARGALDVLYVMSNSTRRHGWQVRRLQDLLAQGTPGTLRVRPARWRCQNQGCEWQTFSDRLPDVARPSARRTCRVAGLTRIFGQAAGGRPAERLMASLGRTVGNGSDAGLFIHRCSRSTQRRGNTSGWSMRRCQEPFWCENLKIFTAIAINSENFVLRNSHY